MNKRAEKADLLKNNVTSIQVYTKHILRMTDNNVFDMLQV